jgi:hypothetical protein
MTQSDDKLSDTDRMRAGLETADPLQRILVSLRTYEGMQQYADWAGESIHSFTSRILDEWLDSTERHVEKATSGD